MSFHRDDERRQSFHEALGSAPIADGVRVRYGAPDGSVARLDVTAVDGKLGLRLQVDGDYQALALPLRCDDESSFHGWGEQYNRTDQRGERFDLFVQEQGLGRTGSPEVLSPAGHAHTTYCPMPYFLDARGHGMLVQTDHRVLVDLCSSEQAVAWIEVEAGAPFEAEVLPGPTPADVVRQLGERVGRPAKPPSWAYDLWIGAQGGREVLLAEVAALEAAAIPVGVFWVQDWTGPRTNLGGGYGVQYRWVADEDHNWSWEKDQETTDHLRRFALIHELLAAEIEVLA